MIALSLRWYMRNGRTRPPAHVFAVCFFTRSASASTCSYGRHPSVQCESERVGGLLQLPPAARGLGGSDPVRAAPGKGESRSLTGRPETYKLRRGA